MASISSMKMMQGATFEASAKRSRTRLAPTPTNISTKPEPEMEKNGTFASPATALASSVLPVPGGPTSSAPLRQLRADVGILLGIVQEVDDLDEGFLRLVLTGDVGKGDAGGLFHVDLRVGLADAAEAAEAAAARSFC